MLESMTLTWARDTKASDKPKAPNNPMVDIELGITISLVYKGAQHKRCWRFLWALSQSAREPISSPQIGAGGPTNGPGRLMRGGMAGWEFWWSHLESKRRRAPTACLSFSHTGLPRVFSVGEAITIHSTVGPLSCRLTHSLWDHAVFATLK